MGKIIIHVKEFLCMKGKKVGGSVCNELAVRRGLKRNYKRTEVVCDEVLCKQ